MRLKHKSIVQVMIICPTFLELFLAYRQTDGLTAILIARETLQHEGVLYVCTLRTRFQTVRYSMQYTKTSNGSFWSLLNLLNDQTNKMQISDNLPVKFKQNKWKVH
jgi:hypothetical protein